MHILILQHTLPESLWKYHIAIEAMNFQH